VCSDSSRDAPPLRNRYVRAVALTAFVVGMAVAVADAFGYADTPDGFFALVGSIVLGWMGVSKWGENVVYTHRK